MPQERDETHYFYPWKSKTDQNEENKNIILQCGSLTNLIPLLDSTHRLLKVVKHLITEALLTRVSAKTNLRKIRFEKCPEFLR